MCQNYNLAIHLKRNKCGSKASINTKKKPHKKEHPTAYGEVKGEYIYIYIFTQTCIYVYTCM